MPRETPAQERYYQTYTKPLLEAQKVVAPTIPPTTYTIPAETYIPEGSMKLTPEQFAQQYGAETPQLPQGSLITKVTQKQEAYEIKYVPPTKITIPAKTEPDIIGGGRWGAERSYAREFLAPTLISIKTAKVPRLSETLRAGSFEQQLATGLEAGLERGFISPIVLFPYPTPAPKHYEVGAAFKSPEAFLGRALGEGISLGIGLYAVGGYYQYGLEKVWGGAKTLGRGVGAFAREVAPETTAKIGQFGVSKVQAIEELIVEPIRFHGQWVKYAVTEGELLEPIRYYGMYGREMGYEVSSKIPIVGKYGERLFGKRVTELTGIKESEVTRISGMEFFQKGEIKLITKERYISPAEYAGLEADWMATKPVKILVAGQEYQVGRVGEELFKTKAIKEFEPYAPDILKVLEAKGKKATWEVYARLPSEPLEQGITLTTRDITGIQIVGKVRKGYEFLYEDLAKRVLGSEPTLPWYEAIKTAPKTAIEAQAKYATPQWMMPLTKQEVASNQILREVGMALPTEKVFPSAWFAKSTVMGTQLGQQVSMVTPQIMKPILPTVTKSLGKQILVQIPKVVAPTLIRGIPSIVKLKPPKAETRFFGELPSPFAYRGKPYPRIMKEDLWTKVTQIPTPKLVEPKRKEKEMAFPRIFQPTQPRKREREAQMSIPTYKQAQPQMPRFATTTITSQITKQTTKLTTVFDVPYSYRMEQQYRFLFSFLRGGLGGDIGGARLWGGKWFYRKHPILTPQKVFERYSYMPKGGRLKL